MHSNMVVTFQWLFSPMVA